ncbi:hypothetical protein WKH57_15235 [Niallia taxi]|uniref:hypothetical protein n=1 Tax=Niallia taxi TaxID=2499688 RepID=UPI003173D887
MIIKKCDGCGEELNSGKYIWEMKETANGNYIIDIPFRGNREFHFHKNVNCLNKFVSGQLKEMEGTNVIASTHRTHPNT